MAQDKVNWVRTQTLANGTEIEVSEKTGITRVRVPGTGRRSVMLYRDELLALLACTVEIQQFLNKNQDIAFSKDESKDARTIKRTHIKTQARVAEDLQALGFDTETINELLTKQQKIS